MKRYRISLNGTCFTWTSLSSYENEQYLSSTPVWVQKTALYRNCSFKSNEWYVTLLVMLDLSAAFDTVKHKILLERLQYDIGISGVPLQWFKSYLSNRSQRIAVQGTLSRLFYLDCGVPQGSCFSPSLYAIYSSKLFNINELHPPDAYCYADDSQLYLSFRLADGLSSQTDAIQAMERCIEDIRHWMVSDRLLPNDEKTEFLLIGTRQQLSKV